MIDVRKVLIEKYKRRELCHFYIISSTTKDQNTLKNLDFWIRSFLCEIILIEKKLSSIKDAQRLLDLGISDILEIKNNDGTYRLDDFEELISFSDYAAFELKQSFSVIYQAEQINELISNKLLKLLEEPQKNKTIFFINSTNKKLMPTIESRAVKINIHPNFLNDDYFEKCNFDINANIHNIKMNNSSSKSKKKNSISVNSNHNYNANLEELKKIMAQKLQSESISKIINLCKNNRKLEDDFLRMVIELKLKNGTSNNSKEQYVNKDKLLKQIQWAQKSQNYHNPISERIIAIYSNYLLE